jgi:hypothetical protein
MMIGITHFQNIVQLLCNFPLCCTELKLPQFKISLCADGIYGLAVFQRKLEHAEGRIPTG